ncbi:hypothetical protein L195_g056756 [Trifolium pratense]|uniref:Uncharacterized protein n=1 Tax=Trifolium pratense TaxID=57577 RepID=A0A2K3KTA5_TRIPR|nr:hypothetical protein L195_g056756 [Trifolium pratense]
MSMSYSESDFVAPFPQTRNFFDFDHANFESPGTQRFNETFRNLYQSGESSQPQPTQQIPQEFTWADLSGDYLNSTWAQGQGSTLALVQADTPATDSPAIQAINFLGVNENNPDRHVELFGVGLRPRNRPNCGTDGHR